MGEERGRKKIRGTEDMRRGGDKKKNEGEEKLPP